jgi:hypothetical protein
MEFEKLRADLTSKMHRRGDLHELYSPFTSEDMDISITPRLAVSGRMY